MISRAYLRQSLHVFRTMSNSLQLNYIKEYSEWLKINGIEGVLVVNRTIGEEPALGLVERKLNAEAWSKSCKKCGLIMLLQIGGAPLPDVLDLARHANGLYTHGVVCIPELFYVPTNLEQLVGFFDMPEFCKRAEKVIPNFASIKFSQSELVRAINCKAGNRTILMGDSKMLSSGMFFGFETPIMTVANMEPLLRSEIYDAMIKKDLKRARWKQIYLNRLIRRHVTKGQETWVLDMKRWLSKKMLSDEG